MAGGDEFLNASLQHQSLRVDLDDPNPRPMIAILEAKPGLVEALRNNIIELVREVRREHGCVTFVAYEARDEVGRFYLYEVYTDAAAFDTHLHTEHVRKFISSLPRVSTGGPRDLIQLDEIAIP